MKRYDVYIMMSRIQISLAPEQAKRAQTRAGQLGVSFAEYVRRLIARDLGQEPGTPDVSAMFNLGDSGGSDIARDKDEMLGDAFEALD